MMVDPVSVAGIVVPPALAVLTWMKEHVAGAELYGALFDPHGNRIAGDDEISVELSENKIDTLWWFEAKVPDGYRAVRMPIVDSGVVEQLGTVTGTSNPDARYWRWVALPPPGRIVGNGSDPNALVEFMVFGYPPEKILEHFRGR